MNLTYQTSVATLIQFIVLGLLNIGDGVNSAVTTCRQDSGDCLGNVFTSIVFYLLVMAWFGIVCALGYAAQERRSRRLARTLIAAEALTALIALFNAKHYTDIIGLLTSIADFFLALWVITLAYRLMRAGGSRVVTKQRGRRRRRPGAGS